MQQCERKGEREAKKLGHGESWNYIFRLFLTSNVQAIRRGFGMERKVWMSLSPLKCDFWRCAESLAYLIATIRQLSGLDAYRRSYQHKNSDIVGLSVHPNWGFIPRWGSVLTQWQLSVNDSRPPRVLATRLGRRPLFTQSAGIGAIKMHEWTDLGKVPH